MRIPERLALAGLGASSILALQFEAERDLLLICCLTGAVL